MVESLYLQSNIPPFPDISTLLWQVNILRASPSGYLLARAKCKYTEMGGYLLCKLDEAFYLRSKSEYLEPNYFTSSSGAAEVDIFTDDEELFLI